MDKFQIINGIKAQVNDQTKLRNQAEERVKILEGQVSDLKTSNSTLKTEVSSQKVQLDAQISSLTDKLFLRVKSFI